MNTEEISNKTLRDFLTGKLDEATTEKLDELSITSRDLADRLAVEQYELVDDWVAGRLDKEHRKEFEQMLARSPALREKVQVSRSLAAASTAVVVERPAKTGFFAGLFAGIPRLAYGVAALAVLIGIIGLIAFVLRRENVNDIAAADPPELQSPTAAAATVPPSNALPANSVIGAPQTTGNVDRVKPTPELSRRARPLFATLALAAPTRGAGDVRSLKLESGVEYVLLTLETEAPSSGRFIVEVGNTSGATDWRSAVVAGRPANGRTRVSVRLPAAKAKSGLIGIRLLDAEAGSEVIDEHVVRVQR